MKKYLKEIIICILQLALFYIFPHFAGPTDIMGMVVLIILGTLLLALILGIITNNKFKYCYPIFVVVIFIPSIWIYYNESALVHSLWYFVDSSIGLMIGSIIRKISNKEKRVS